ncbi:type II secretion system protein [Lapidilactobacillus luobeiensis]|uniref:type II secretion system protein n=1 Tax=Lapidilactobacillus luobeiensis TaxID=2950371 RepID=UPI0021C3B799|nr:type II secretion system protein [Lapidilactobacillus luobeiensis]
MRRNKRCAGFILLESVIDLLIIVGISLFLFETISVDQRKLTQVQQTYQKSIKENNELKRQIAQKEALKRPATLPPKDDQGLHLDRSGSQFSSSDPD